MKREKFENISFAPAELGIIMVRSGVGDGPADEDLGDLIADSTVSRLAIGTKIKMWKPPRGAGNHVPGLLSLSGDAGWEHLYAISQLTISMMEDIAYAMKTNKRRLLDSIDEIRKIVDAS